MKSVVYTNDIVLYSAHADVTFAAYLTQTAINHLICNGNKLGHSPSPLKSTTMVFSLRSFNYVNATLACGNISIPIVDIVVYLGITLDSKLLWIDHINCLASRIGPAISFLKMLSSSDWGSDPITMTMFYKSFIRSKIDDGSNLYGSTSHTQLSKLDRLQN